MPYLVILQLYQSGNLAYKHVLKNKIRLNIYADCSFFINLQYLADPDLSAKTYIINLYMNIHQVNCFMKEKKDK